MGMVTSFGCIYLNKAKCTMDGATLFGEFVSEEKGMSAFIKMFVEIIIRSIYATEICCFFFALENERSNEREKRRSIK